MSNAETTVKHVDKPRSPGKPGRLRSVPAGQPTPAQKRRQVAAILRAIETEANALARGADRLLTRLA